jgi:hypothetical protein
MKKLLRLAPISALLAACEDAATAGALVCLPRRP